MPPPLITVFQDLPDPRITTANSRHALVDIPAVAVCAIIRGASGWEPIAEYGRRNEPFFRRFLVPGHGIPGHDTFYRVSTRLRPAAFADRFATRTAAAGEGTGPIPIAIDGTSARRAKRGTAATGCRHVVRGWATANRLALGPVAVPDGASEIGVIPERLRARDLAGAVVTIDAAGCRAGNARRIRGGGGHDLLAVRGNRPTSQAAGGGVRGGRRGRGRGGPVRPPHHGRGRPRPARGAVGVGGLRPAGGTAGVAGRGGRGVGAAGAGGERGGGDHGPLLPQQPHRDGGGDGGDPPGPLGDRERVALGT